VSLRASVRLAAVALLACVLPARAATLVHEYALRGSLNDNLGGPALTALGGQISALGYVFAANQGLTLSSSVLSATNFTLEFSFRFDSTSGYRKIADFHDLGSDSGLYNLSGALNFYPVVTAGQSDFSAGVDVHVVLTRDSATNVVTGYVNGQQRFSFVDTSGLATITAVNNRLQMFVDDFSTGQGEASAGTVNYLRMYNGALTATEVAAAYAAGPPLAIPEPATATLFAFGAALTLAHAGRVRSRRDAR
jgi:hypothetical protein